MNRAVRIWERFVSKKKAGKLRLLIAAVCLFSLALFSFIKTAHSPAQGPESSPVERQIDLSLQEPQDHSGQRSPAPAVKAGPSLIKTHLLIIGRSSPDAVPEKPVRNIFMPILPPHKDEPPLPKEALEDIKPVINIKFVGIIEDQAESPRTGLVRHAILSMDGEVILAQKGDIVNGQYEITAIKEDSVEIRIKDSGYTEKLTIE